MKRTFNEEFHRSNRFLWRNFKISNEKIRTFWSSSTNEKKKRRKKNEESRSKFEWRKIDEEENEKSFCFSSSSSSTSTSTSIEKKRKEIRSLIILNEINEKDFIERNEFVLSVIEEEKRRINYFHRSSSLVDRTTNKTNEFNRILLNRNQYWSFNLLSIRFFDLSRIDFRRKILQKKKNRAKLVVHRFNLRKSQENCFFADERPEKNVNGKCVRRHSMKLFPI